MLKNYLKEELHREAAALEKIKSDLKINPESVLLSTKGSFYYYTKDECGKPGKRHYLRRGDTDTLRHITSLRYLKVKAEFLAHNIDVLENALKNVFDYDDAAIIDALPKTYASAIELMRSASYDKVFQSQNPKKREDLVVTTSTGVKVRTKGELALYETLNDYGLKIFYEKKLVLTDRRPLPDGSFEAVSVDVYPDFTIVLPDGSEIYWELCGMFDKDSYRSKQYLKFKLYYDNGIYMPKNLIVTMEDPNKPLDIQAIRRIIAGEKVLSNEVQALVNEASAMPCLTERQLKLLELAARGFTICTCW